MLKIGFSMESQFTLEWTALPLEEPEKVEGRPGSPAPETFDD
jgi:hypothetical protein